METAPLDHRPEDERFHCEIGHRQPNFVSKNMVGGQRHAEAIPVEAVQHNASRIRQWRDHHCRVECSIAKAGDLAGRCGLAQFQPHFWARQAEQPDCVRQSPVKCTPDIAEPHETSATRCRLTRHEDRIVRLPQRLARFAKKCATGIRQASNPVTAPLDQGHTQIGFQPLYRHRQGWLRHAKAMRGAVEIFFFGNGNELLHLPQVDHPARDF